MLGTTGARENQVSLVPFTLFDSVISSSTETGQTDPPILSSPEVQGLIERGRNDLILTREGEIMWIGDVPMSPDLRSPTVMIAEASRGGRNTQQNQQIIGVCQTIQGRAEISPMIDVDAYMFQFNQREFFSAGATANIIRPPKKGRVGLSPYSDPRFHVYNYIPNKISSGDGKDDFFIISVEKNGVVVNIRYYIHIQSPDEVLFELCDRRLWKISPASSTTGRDGPAAGQFSNGLMALLASASQTFAGFSDLDGSSVGQTTGSGTEATITCAPTAAGHSWFIDYTPYLNDEFLPASYPNEWTARPGRDGDWGVIGARLASFVQAGCAFSSSRHCRRDAGAG